MRIVCVRETYFFPIETDAPRRSDYRIPPATASTEGTANRQNTVDIDGSFFTYFSRSNALATDDATIFTGDRAKNTAEIVVDVVPRWHKGCFCCHNTHLQGNTLMVAHCFFLAFLFYSWSYPRPYRYRMWTGTLRRCTSSTRIFKQQLTVAINSYNLVLSLYRTKQPSLEFHV